MAQLPVSNTCNRLVSVSYHSLLLSMRDADYGRPGLCGATLFSLATDYLHTLRCEVMDLFDSMEGSDVTQEDHVTHWTGPTGEVVQYSLLNGSGRYTDTTTDHLLTTRGKYFADRQRYPGLARLMAYFPEAINFRLNRLSPGASLSPHEEHITVKSCSGRVALKARFHLPLMTNSDAEVLLAGQIFHLQAGHIYYFNNGSVHAASNSGAEHRVHVVWDVLLTESVCQRMFGSGTHDFPGIRITGLARDIAPRRAFKVEKHRRSAPVVSWMEAQQVDYFPLQ